MQPIPLLPRVRRFLVLPGIVAFIVFVLPVVLLIGFFALRVGGEYLLRTRFVSSAWQSAAQPADSFPRNARRLRMVDDLLKRHELEGMTRLEATALLGDPDVTPEITGWDMTYYLGPERSPIGMDSEWLVLRLGDSKTTVVEARIIAP